MNAVRVEVLGIVRIAEDNLRNGASGRPGAIGDEHVVPGTGTVLELEHRLHLAGQADDLEARRIGRNREAHRGGEIERAGRAGVRRRWIRGIVPWPAEMDLGVAGGRGFVRRRAHLAGRVGQRAAVRGDAELAGADIGRGIVAVVGLDGGVAVARVLDPDIAVLRVLRNVEVARLAAVCAPIAADGLDLDLGDRVRQADRIVGAVGAIDTRAVGLVVVVRVDHLDARGRGGHGLHARRIDGVRPHVAEVDAHLSGRALEVFRGRQVWRRVWRCIRGLGCVGSRRRDACIRPRLLDRRWVVRRRRVGERCKVDRIPRLDDRQTRIRRWWRRRGNVGWWVDDHDLGLPRLEQEMRVAAHQRADQAHGNQYGARIFPGIALHGIGPSISLRCLFGLEKLARGTERPHVGHVRHMPTRGSGSVSAIGFPWKRRVSTQWNC